MYDTIHKVVREVSKWIPVRKSEVREAERVIIKEVGPVMSGAAQAFVRVAGLSGALAVSIGAYGAHVFKPGHPNPELAHVFDTGNRYHLLHSIALLGVPLTRRPQLVGALMVAGILLFSGSCYYHSLTGNKQIRQVTPYGGMLLIAAWLAIFV